jgi:hypothetical protein
MRENDVEHLHNAAIRCGANEQDFEQAREEFWSAWRTRDVFVRTPLSDDVDEQLADRVENAHLHSLPEDKRALVAHRIARLPLTASRARRLVDLCLGSGFFYKLDRCVEIARVVAPLGADIPRPLPSDSRGLAAYEILVGEHALGQWFDQALAQNNFWDALELITHADSLRTSANEAALKDKVPFEELGPLVSLQRKHPWLLTEDQVTAAVETDRYPDEQWLRTGPLARYLWPAARRKAETTKNTRLAVWLIDRLCGRDSELDRALLGTAITRVEQSGTEAMEAHVVGRLLHSGKRWEQEGIRLVSWSVANASSKAALWLDRVLDRSVAAAKQIDSKAKRRPSEASVMKTVHSLFAGTLAHAARTSVEAGNVERAHRLLRALTHVSTPPRVMSRIMSLRSLAGVEPLLDLIEANEGLAREAGTSYEASHVMSALLTVAGLMPADEMGEDDEARDTLRAQ